VSGAEDVRVAPLTGDALARALPELARLRIEVFREFPYLYDGSLDYEQRYLKTYAETPGSVIVGAFAGDRFIGAATALPMRGEPENVTGPLRAAGYDVDTLFYFGESVLQKAWRGRGIGVRFFQEREAWARRTGDFSHAVFCAVIRPEGHPRRPAGYVPLDAFWRRRGYTPIPGLACNFVWKDLDEAAETAKPMAYWIKRL
jgi:GNAT superfamily N-acetyltransferase